MAYQPTTSAEPSTVAANAFGAAKNDKSAQEHLWRANPSPKQGFEVVFELHDAPGPFAGFGGYAHYQSFNCNFVTSEWAGTRSQPTKMIPVAAEQIDTTHYRATFYLDGLLDEDYYGKGVCHWDLIGVTVGFKATGAKGETDYAFDLDKKAWRDGGQDRRYYWKGDYPSLPIGGGNQGRRDPDGFSADFRSNIFSISATVRAKP
ncbi:hypothetical protein [Ottowia sp.]|uniref:hypothetical protein n=1 Tax=Ottowia sp. TaxID=1898956 RepID=UPI003A87D737